MPGPCTSVSCTLLLKSLMQKPSTPSSTPHLPRDTSAHFSLPSGLFCFPGFTEGAFPLSLLHLLHVHLLILKASFLSPACFFEDQCSSSTYYFLRIRSTLEIIANGKQNRCDSCTAFFGPDPEYSQRENCESQQTWKEVFTFHTFQLYVTIK